MRMTRRDKSLARPRGSARARPSTCFWFLLARATWHIDSANGFVQMLSGMLFSLNLKSVCIDLSRGRA
uniref:Putative secreted protein n=1 Tax=Anopheles darlingi TaxID=43151 RepID=A0A2M4DKB5_ANODA